MEDIAPMGVVEVLARGDRVETLLGDCALKGLSSAAESADGPILFLVHGFLYNPTASCSARCLGRQPWRGAPGQWPERLGFTGASDDPMASGLAVAFGWNSYPARSQGVGNVFRRAYDNGAAAGWALASALRAAARGGRRVDVFAHSLGARVAFLALRRAAAEGWADRIGAIFALGAAEYRAVALRAAQACDDEAGPQVVNVIARENDVFDGLMQAFGPRRRFGVDALPLGARGLGRRRTGWIDLQIDHPTTAAWLGGDDAPVDIGLRPIRHDGFYQRPGLIAFYRRVLIERLTVAALRRQGAPEALSPRWSRFAQFPAALGAQSASTIVRLSRRGVGRMAAPAPRLPVPRSASRRGA